MRCVTGPKACFAWTFHEKLFETLFGDNVDKGYDWKKAFTFFKFKNFDYILKFTFEDNFTEVVLPVTLFYLLSVNWEYKLSIMT